MKIAFVTDDGVKITQHFGRAGKYLVVGIEGKKELSRELRDKLGHTHFRQPGKDHAHEVGQPHNTPDDQSKHVQMMAAIEDCDVVVCGGMGMGAFQSIQAMGKEVFMTNTPDINIALKGYLAGELQNMSDLVH
jgi:predicted Fe-Mo cluster-binding NifX family protein